MHRVYQTGPAVALLVTISLLAKSYASWLGYFYFQTEYSVLVLVRFTSIKSLSTPTPNNTPRGIFPSIRLKGILKGYYECSRCLGGLVVCTVYVPVHR